MTQKNTTLDLRFLGVIVKPARARANWLATHLASAVPWSGFYR